jgi:hypothetical protein
MGDIMDRRKGRREIKKTIPPPLAKPPTVVEDLTRRWVVLLI